MYITIYYIYISNIHCMVFLYSVPEALFMNSFIKVNDEFMQATPRFHLFSFWFERRVGCF